MTTGPLLLHGPSAVCAIGIDAIQSWTSARGDVSRIEESSIMDRRFEPIRMALLPEDALEPLHPKLEELGLTSRRRRMLRLAAPALRQTLSGWCDGQAPLPPLFLGLPEPTIDTTGQANPRPPATGFGDGSAGGPQPDPNAAFVSALRTQADVEFDEGGTKLFPRGRAAALLALDAALAHLRSRQADTVVVGGVDTFLDLRLLAELDAEGRLLGSTVADGFIPGEGAAFFVLSSRAQRPGAGATDERGDAAAPLLPIRVAAAGTARDPGHRYGDEPAKGEALAEALEAMRGGLGKPIEPVRATFAGLNGESFGAKEWGVARLRHRDLFSPEMAIEHPADCCGDAGAATGALLIALAHVALVKQHRTGPVLVWASSDREDCACAYLQALA